MKRDRRDEILEEMRSLTSTSHDTAKLVALNAEFDQLRVDFWRSQPLVDKVLWWPLRMEHAIKAWYANRLLKILVRRRRS